MFYSEIRSTVNVFDNEISVIFNTGDNDIYPVTESLANFLKIEHPLHGIDLSIDENKNIKLILEDEKIATNYDALEKALEIKNTILQYNTFLKYTKVKEYKVYGIEYYPGGKLYWFRSDEELEIGNMVVVYSLNIIDYGIVRSIKREEPKIYENRNICKKVPIKQ